MQDVDFSHVHSIRDAKHGALFPYILHGKLDVLDAAYLVLHSRLPVGEVALLKPLDLLRFPSIPQSAQP